MTNLSDQDLNAERILHIRTALFDPTTAAAMHLAELRAEERAAVSRGDTAALQDIRRSIMRELAWEKA